MESARLLVKVAASTAEPRAVAADLLAIPAFEGEDLSEVAGLDRATGGEVTRALASREFRGKTFDLFVTPLVGSDWLARRIALVGAGPSHEYDADRARKVAAAVAVAARDRRVERLAFIDRGGSAAGRDLASACDPAARTQAIAEGLALGAYQGGRYKTIDRPDETLVELTVVVPDLERLASLDVSASVTRGGVLGACTNLARDLTNAPAGLLTPRLLAGRAEDLVAGAGIDVEILDEEAIIEHGMGLLRGVSQGSHEPPRLLVLRYQPADVRDGPVLGLVGKGITFDAGGISIKPAAGMSRMKDDMAGGAAVICALRAIGLIGAPLRVIGIVPCAENMPGGGAIRPGDVLTSASGKTVEVIDTDAEGRLILADALWYARQIGASHLVDVATLTGACQIALGTVTSGLFGRPAAWVEQVRDVANRAGDRAWILPIFEDYRDQLRSEVADLTNSGGRPAGAITAAVFLSEFAGDLPWAHMDIAGTAWAEEARPGVVKGATGVGVRTLAGLALSRPTLVR